MSALGDTVKEIGRARIAVIALAGIGLFAFFMITALHMSTGSMSPLYSGLSLEDSSKIFADLE